MDKLKSIDLTLTAAANILNVAAQDIRDAGLEPVADNIRRIGTALVEIFEIQQAIHAVRPELKPAYLQVDEHSPDNRALTIAYAGAWAFEENRNIDSAVAVFAQFLLETDSPMHKEIAENEMARLRQQ
jgi:hypothetical protein